MSGQIAIQSFSIKRDAKISEQLNGNSTINKSFSLHTQTQMQMQTEFEAFKTQDDSISGLFV